MPVDPQVRTLLEQLAASGTPGLEQLSVTEARELMASLAPLTGPLEEVAAVEDIAVPGPHGPMAVRLYRPTGAARAVEEPPPRLIRVHGGGWVLGDLASADGTAR